MKKFVPVIFLVCLAMVTFFVLKDDTKDVSANNFKDIPNDNEISTVTENIGKALYNNSDYTFGLEHNLTNKALELTVKLPANQYNDKSKEEVISIIENYLEEKEYNPKSFPIEVIELPKKDIKSS
ncbi:hypothetical protein [Virgibacillus salexigens]|uniref:hypothetical protein n=1 Tax=Virgibacillus salexigens TaxID=61016 RepID=UPI0030813073